MNKIKIYNGDIYELGQSINGISRFIFYNEKWFYYNEVLNSEYEYDQQGLTDLIHEDYINGFGDVTYLGNIFSYITP
jgi:hypothetical protein